MEPGFKLSASKEASNSVTGKEEELKLPHSVLITCNVKLKYLPFSAIIQGIES